MSTSHQSTTQKATDKVGMSALTAGLLALAAAVSFGAATLFEFWRGDTRSAALRAVVAEREEKLATLKEGISKEASSYKWVKKEAGVVQLPIARAMEVTLPDLKNSPPRASGVPVDPAAALAPVGNAAGAQAGESNKAVPTAEAPATAKNASGAAKE